MTSAPISTARGAWLLLSLRGRRFVNLVGALGRKQVPVGARTATAAKSSSGWILGLVAAIFMIFGAGSFAQQAITNLKTIAFDQLLEAAALQTTLLFAGALLVSIGTRELAQPDWDLEWLVTLPVPVSTLLAGRLLSRALINPALAILPLPFLTMFAWDHGFGWLSPVAALLVTMPLALVAGALHMLVDTGLRLALRPAQLRNLQALLSITSIVVSYIAVSTSTSPHPLVVSALDRFGAAALWLPTGLAVRALAGGEQVGSVPSLMVLMLMSSAILTLAAAVLARQLRDGVMTGGARESGRDRSALHAESAPAAPRRFLTALQAREVRLLGRDRNFMVQTLLLPLLIFGMQIYLNLGNRGEVLSGSPRSANHIAAVAFGVASYALIFSALQTLNAEGQALWLLFTFPRPLVAILREKGLFWITVATGYAACILAVGSLGSNTSTLESATLAVLVVLGVPIYGVIATALGVFACDPLALEVQKRVRPSYLYLYMSLSSAYLYALYASSLWQRAALLLLTALLAFALWQKAKDHLPFLLDPSASPPARLSLSDGLIAALGFFVIQGMVGYIAVTGGARLSADILLIAFVVAGAVTFGLARYIFWRSKTEGVPRIIGPGWGRAIVLGLGAGALGLGLALAYLRLASRYEWFRKSVEESPLGAVEAGAWFAILAVFAAPFFEEFIFRGLVFGGLRRSAGAAASVAGSAAIFAIVHPPAAVVPVFLVGALAALVYARTNLLIGAMATHALYNGGLLVANGLFRAH